MDVKVIFSSGGKYNKNTDQKIADDDTIDAAKKILKALTLNGHDAKIVRVTPSKISNVAEIKADAVFNLCEWSGKDSPLGINVIKILQESNVPFTGADLDSYIWGCDKITMKKRFDSHKIPTPKWAAIDPTDTKKIIEHKIQKLKCPIMIKPAYEHCAIGIDKSSVVHSKKYIAKRIAKLFEKYKEPVIVEEFINGREFTVTVLKNHVLHIFPPAETIFKTKEKDRFLSFKSQWIDKRMNYYSKVVTQKELRDELKNLGRNIFKKMDCKGYIRIDLRMKGNKIYVLEVNVNPGITPYESYGLTVSTQAAGWTFDRLVNEITLAAVGNAIN